MPSAFGIRHSAFGIRQATHGLGLLHKMRFSIPSSDFVLSKDSPVDTDEGPDYSKWRGALDQSINYYPQHEPHFELVRELICNWLKETQSHVTTLRKSLTNLNAILDVGICDSPLIGGYSEPGYDPETGQRSSLVQINLGVFPKILGLANRAHGARFFGAHEHWIKESFEQWSVNETSIGTLWLGGGHVDQATYTSVYDSATLSLLHELAHCQEPFEPPSSPSESRAVEACADEGSGYLFARRILSQQVLWRKPNEAEVLDRVSDASFFLAALVYWASMNSGKKDDYHHPWTRMRCFLRGACFALYGADRDKWQRAFHQAWNRQYDYGLAFAVFSPEHLWFWQDQEEVNRDWNRFMMETHDRMIALRDQLPPTFLLTPITQGMKWIQHLL